MAKCSTSYTISILTDGTGISSRVERFMATNTNQAPDESSLNWTDWSTAYAMFGENYRYFWQKETINYTDGTAETGIYLFTIYNMGERVVIQYCYGDDEEPFDADYLIGTNTYLIATDDFIIGTNIWTDEELPQVEGMLIWRREGKYDPNTAYFPTTWVVSRLTGEQGKTGTSANLLEVKLDSETYPCNFRLVGEAEITATAVLQGKYATGTISVKNSSAVSLAYIKKKNGTAITATSSVSDVQDGDYFSICIPFTSSDEIHVVLSSEDATEKIISCVDQTEYNHNFGVVSAASSIASYTDRWGNTCYPYIGDYFIASTVFAYKTGSNTQIGYPYEYSINGWEEVQSIDDTEMAEKISKLVDDLARKNSELPAGQKIDLPEASPAYTYVFNFAAQTGIINNIFSRVITLLQNGLIKSSNADSIDEDGYLVNNGFRLEDNGTSRFREMWADEVHFKKAIIEASSTLKGEVVNDVFETVLATESATRCLATSPDATTGAVDGLLGSEARDYIEAFANTFIPDSHQTTNNPSSYSYIAVASVSNVYLNGSTNRKSGATAMMRFSTVSGFMNLAQLSTNHSTTPYTNELTWTNPYPTDIIIRPLYSPIEADWVKTTTTVSWVETDNGYSSNSIKPRVTNWPSNPTAGDTTTIIDWVSDVADEYGKWHYHWVDGRAVASTDYDTDTTTGSYTVKVNNQIQTNKTQITIPSGAVLTVTFTEPETKTGYTFDGYTEGSVTVRWKENENYQSGVLFVKNNSRADSFYLSQLTDTYWDATTSIYSTAIPSYVLNLEIGTSNPTWDTPFSSGLGKYIHKLYKFAWTSYAAGSFTSFASKTSAQYTTESGSTTYVIGSRSTLSSATITQNTLVMGYSAQYGSTGTVSMNTSTYYRDYSIDFTPNGRTLGVKSKELTPFTTDTYDLGTSSYRWKSVHSQSFDQTSALKTKEKIAKYEGNALDILKDTEIVSYRNKSDRKSKKGHTRYGFIADRTREELATPEHDTMDLGSCIGIIIKAIQELSDKIDNKE